MAISQSKSHCSRSFSYWLLFPRAPLETEQQGNVLIGESDLFHGSILMRYAEISNWKDNKGEKKPYYFVTPGEMGIFTLFSYKVRALTKFFRLLQQCDILDWNKA